MGTNKKDPAITGSQNKTTTDIIAKNNVPVNFNAETLIAQAIDSKVPVETMERLLAMRKELKAEWAKEQYDQAMAKFQAECPTIQKTKEVRTSAGTVAYKYAPLEAIVEQVKQYIQQNGFSYSTSMELLESGVVVELRVTHSSGHSESTKMTVPLGNKTNVMSASQVVAAAQTFAKRYAFCNAFGILTGDEDVDASPAVMSSAKDEPFKSPPKEVIGEATKLLLTDLVGADTKEQYEKTSGEITLAFHNGKINSTEFAALSKEAKNTVKRIEAKLNKNETASKIDRGEA